MKKILAFAAALALVFTFSARPAGAQVPTVVDRTAVTLTYLPAGAGSSSFTGAVSYAFGPTWDLLVSYTSNSGPAVTPPTSVFRVGGRYHLRPPSAGFDMYLTAQYASPSTGASTVLLGGGLIQTLAPALKGYATLNYDTNAQVILYDVGVQYQFNRQFALVAGWTPVRGYVGISFNLGSR